MAVVISDRLLESSDRLLDAEPDEHLVGLVQTGHEGAFAAIVRRYERELQAQARRLASDGRGEDAVQQAFLNAFTALQRGSEVRHLRGWLHQILRNEVTRARRPIDAPLAAAVAYGEPLEDMVQRRATVRATLAELSYLPDRQRDALLSTAVFGLPREHVARTMGLSEGAVRQLVHRARLRLRQAVTAIIPFPLVKLFGAARSGVDATPDAALGAGTAASGGLVIKVGALLASGVVATGIAVTHTFPSHHATAPAHGNRHHLTQTRVTRGVPPALAVSSTSGAPASLTNTVPVREHGPATRADRLAHSGPGRLSGTGSGRHGEPGSGHGVAAGRGHDGSPAGRGDDGSGRSGSGTSGRGQQGGGSRSGSGPGDDGLGSGSGRSGSGSGSGSGHQGDSGSGSGSPTGSAGSGSDGGSGSSDGGHGSGHSGSNAGGVSSADGAASTPAASGSSGSAPATATTDKSSGGGGSSDGGSGKSGDANAMSANTQTVSAQSPDSGSGSGSGGNTENSSGSRDVSGSLHSSSS
jgi:RNA polymerase sigma factor (sigma-70 family)